MDYLPTDADLFTSEETVPSGETLLAEVPADDDYWTSLTQQAPPADDYIPSDAPEPDPGMDVPAHQVSDDLADTAVGTLHQCLASCQGRTGAELLDMLSYAISSDQVMSYLDPSERKTFVRLSEIMTSAFGVDRQAAVDWFDIPDLQAASPRVLRQVSAVRSLIGSKDLPTNPAGTWRALVGRVTRISARGKALHLAQAIDADEPDEVLMDVFRSMVPPSSRTEVVNASFSRSAAEWEAHDRSAAASAAPYRISSGYPTLDWSLTMKNTDGSPAEPLGAFAPGEFHVVAAPTGNGKSAMSRRLITAAAQDLVVGWGRANDRVLICITEESPRIVYEAAGLAAGGQFHHLASNVTIANTGASRRRIVHAVWDQVLTAVHLSRETGISLDQAGLPAMIVWDYIGGTVEAGEPQDTVAMERNANLAMRGFAQWDIDAMEMFSGESFSAYAGMPWPENFGSFKPVVVAFAQFVKLKDPLWYDPTIKGISVSDFVVERPDGSAGWEVRPGDFRLPTQGEVRGSGVLINHATSLLFLHRSRPQKNPKVMDPKTGKFRLVDNRARIMLVKTRNGADLPFIPMQFDSQPSGPRGQFFDVLAEAAIESGKLDPGEAYSESGDPITPPRPCRTPFDSVAY